MTPDPDKWARVIDPEAFEPRPEGILQAWREPRRVLARAKANKIVEGVRDAQTDALERIESWSRAYPLSVFPEPDFRKAAELLRAGGMTLDAISASNMRHVVEGVGKIAREALNQPKEADKDMSLLQDPDRDELAAKFDTEAEK